LLYSKIKEAVFLERPNRFIAEVLVDGIKERVHVKNTGRCKELLIPGAKIYLEESDKEERKTRFDLVMVEKGDKLINMDSQSPNEAVFWFVKEGGLGFLPTLVKREVKFQNSRFDFYIEDKERSIFMEVKGVTLEENGVVRFPDAPSERAIKHVEELIHAVNLGYEAIILFVIQMGEVLHFEPNWVTQKKFGEVLQRAKEAGVHILAYDCIVSRENMVLHNLVKIDLKLPQKDETK
jgi:sugar fermentation stimulation protein